MPRALPLVVPCLVIALCACEDPLVAQRVEAQRQLDEACSAITLAARQASVDRVAAAEDLRSAAAKVQSIPGASSAQQQAAAAMAASARTQAALLELGRLNQIESSNRASRALALGLMRASDAMHSFIAAHDKSAVAPSISAFAPQQAEAQGASRSLDSAHADLESRVSELRRSNQSALEQAEVLSVEAEVTRQRGLGAGRGEITVIAEEAGRQRDGAREFRTQAAIGEMALASQESVLRLHGSDAESARRRAAAVERAMAALEVLAQQFDATGVEGGEIVSNLRESITELVASTDPSKNEGWTEGVKRLTADLEEAKGALSQALNNESGQRNVTIALARALFAQSEAHFQHALLLHHLSVSATMESAASALERQADAELSTAQERAKEAIEAYTSAKESLSGSREASAELAALASTIDRAIAAIGRPSFDVPSRSAPRAKPTTPASASADDAGDASPDSASAGDGPPFATVDALAAFVGGGSQDSSALLRIDEAFQGSSPDAKALLATIVPVAKATARLKLAMKAKFGSTSLGQPFDQMEDAGKPIATVIDATDTSATIDFGGPMGSFKYSAVKTDDGWKVDLDATAEAMSPQERAQIAGASAMTRPLASAFDDVAARVESGEFADAEQVQGALMAAIQGAMQGTMPGGG
ncbi:MAG: hypothetical protein EXS03_04410 [Phycisphaerales bacterium]|nr:hypothetical protein [Phycisphaerales bacterium]